MTTAGKEARSKVWVWILVILLVLVLCCCITAGGGYLYLNSQGKTIEDALSGGLLEPQVVVPLPQTMEPLDEGQPPSPAIATAAPVLMLEGQMVVMASSGVWTVNENTAEAVQLSSAPLDAPWHPQEGLSPDGQIFAYITGIGGASMNPILIALDLAQRVQALQLEMTGPLSQPGVEMIPGDPGFEAVRAMEFSNGLAWSPDGRFLAFSAAMDGDSADVYLYDRRDGAVTRLSNESGHASSLHWSPDGRFIEYVSVESFGTGAGMAMVGLWAIDMQTREAVMLERLESGGEVFLGWTDGSHFLIHSWGAACTAYNMRVVDASDGAQRVVVDGCFSAAAYNPRDQVGLMSVADFNVENCMCGIPLAEAALYAFYLDQEPIPMSRSEVYQIDFLPKGNVFAFQPVDEPYAVYDAFGTVLVVPPEVAGLKPFPASPDGYWAWYRPLLSDDGGELWVTLNNEKPVLLTSSSSGKPAWSDDGQTLYYLEDKTLFKASAPDFVPVAVPGVTGELLDVVNG